MSEIFKLLMSKIIEVYMNDTMVNRKVVEDLPNDITSVFNILDKTGMKLNLDKCTFRV